MSALIETLIPELQPYARALVYETARMGLQPRITSTRRSTAEQARLRRRYLAGLQPYYVAPPGQSPHEFGWAFDMVVTPMSSLSYVGWIWQSWGGYWGGVQGDPVHFQYPGFKQRVTVSADLPWWTDFFPAWLQLEKVEPGHF